MNKMRNFASRSSLFIFLIILISASTCLAQSDPNNLYLKEGKIISEASASNSSGEIEVIKYRIELIDLPKPLKLQTDKPALETAFRIVVITEKPLPVGDYSIWIDHKQLNALKIKPDAIAIIFYAKTLPNGTLKLAISKKEEIDLDTRLILPGTVFVPSEYTTSAEEIAASLPVIKLQKLNFGFPYILITIRIPDRPCRVQNSIVHIEIGGKTYSFTCNGDAFAITFYNVEEFSRIRDNAEIFLKDDNLRILTVIGNIDKNAFE